MIPLLQTDNSPFNLPINNILPNNNQKQYNTKVRSGKNSSSPLRNMLATLKEHDRKYYLDYCKQFYKLIRWQKLSFNENGYAVVPENHLSLFVRYGHIGEQTVINRFKDGEKRRNRLFIDGCIIRKIKPQISIYELFYNLMHRVYWYYDNSDGILSEELIAQKCVDVMEYDVESMDFRSLNAGSILTSAAYCRNNGISRKSHSRTALQLENYARIKSVYDESRSISENIESLHTAGIKCCYKTLQRYCKTMGINPNPQQIPIEDWYDSKLSV